MLVKDETLAWSHLVGDQWWGADSSHTAHRCYKYSLRSSFWDFIRTSWREDSKYLDNRNTAVCTVCLYTEYTLYFKYAVLQIQPSAVNHCLQPSLCPPLYDRWGSTGLRLGTVASCRGGFRVSRLNAGGMRGVVRLETGARAGVGRWSPQTSRDFASFCADRYSPAVSARAHHRGWRTERDTEQATEERPVRSMEPPFRVRPGGGAGGCTRRLVKRCCRRGGNNDTGAGLSSTSGSVRRRWWRWWRFVGGRIWAECGEKRLQAGVNLSPTVCVRDGPCPVKGRFVTCGHYK